MEFIVWWTFWAIFQIIEMMFVLDKGWIMTGLGSSPYVCIFTQRTTYAYLHILTHMEKNPIHLYSLIYTIHYPAKDWIYYNVLQQSHIHSFVWKIQPYAMSVDIYIYTKDYEHHFHRIFLSGFSVFTVYHAIFSQQMHRNNTYFFVYMKSYSICSLRAIQFYLLFAWSLLLQSEKIFF